MSQVHVLRILKNVYLSGNLGWFSARQIRKICLNDNFDIGYTSLTRNLKRLYLSNFVDRIPYKTGFLYRYRHPNKNKLIA